MESQDKEKEYIQHIWEIYRKEWETADREKQTKLNKRMLRWQELMKNGMSASQAYFQVMEEKSDESPIYTAIEEKSDYRVMEEPSGKRLTIASGPRMGKAPLVFLSLALVAAIVYGFIITRDRNTVNAELESVQSKLTSTQLELDSTKQTIASTQSELTSTKLEFTSTQSELTSTNQRLSSVLNELGATRTELEAIDAKLKLYEDTTGIKIFSGVQPRARGAGPIELVNNPTTTDPSWQQLISFLRADPTDDKTWTEGIFVSGDFAEMLHNNAEAAGIKAALVGVFFEGEITGHGLNAFKTTDRGLVYVDCTGGDWSTRFREQLYGYTLEYDKIAYMVKGEEFGLVSIDKATSPKYSYYEQTGKLLSDWLPMGIVESIEIYW